jgi:hypothetical protein
LCNCIEQQKGKEMTSNNAGYWERLSVAAVVEGAERPIRVATNGKRIRIRCTDLRFDPPIEMELSDFKAIMSAAVALGVSPDGEVEVERNEVQLGANNA